MKFKVGFLILLWDVAGEASSVEIERTCLLQLGKGKSPSGEFESVVQHTAHGKNDNARLPSQDPGLASTDKLGSKPALGEVELAHQVEVNDTSVHEPRAPEWKEYPSTLAGILDDLVITRWHGTYKEVQSSGLSSPVPGLIEKFDCVIHHAYEKMSPTCNTLLVSPKWPLMNRVKDDLASGAINVQDGKFVAFFGIDQHLSTCRGVVKLIGSHFKHIYFEGYDVLDDKVDVLPIGLSEYYLRFQDWNVLSNLAKHQSADANPRDKEHTVLAAFGSFWPEFNTNPSRTSARGLCNANQDQAWLHCGDVPKEKWWTTLKEYSFVLDPTGGGVQSTKFYEALLARAVPITTRESAFVKLHEKGWPMVLVNSYSEVASMNLAQVYEDLKPRIESIQPYLHVDGYFNYLLTGKL